MDFPSMRFEDALAKYTDDTKPIMLYFTGYGCVNAVKVEQAGTLTEPKIIKYIKENYYFVSLYVDDRKKLSEAEQAELSDYYEKPIRTVGNANTALQMEIANSNSQPCIAIIDRNNQLVIRIVGYETMEYEDRFYEYLKEGLKIYKRQSKK